MIKNTCGMEPLAKGLQRVIDEVQKQTAEKIIEMIKLDPVSVWCGIEGECHYGSAEEQIENIKQQIRKEFKLEEK